MKMNYDPEVDALFVRFSEGVIVESEEVRPGLILDFDKDGLVVALEMLKAKSQLGPSAVAQFKAA